MKFGKFLLLYLIITFAVLGTVSVSKVNAQASTDIMVDTVPQSPAPYENTSIALSSYIYNLDSILISWSVNGKTALSGIGKKSFSITAPALGEETNVVATIYPPSGAIETKIPIRPSVMVLLWQADDSYVPPFYEGKALPAPDSEVKVVVMPEIRTSSGLADSNNMTYNWKKDYTNDVDGSGYAKNFFVYTNDYLENSNNISVTASTLDQQYSSVADVDIGITQPKILFYKNDNTFGTLSNITLPDTYKIQGTEILEAVPYFISPKDIQNGALSWSWFINDVLVNLTSVKKNLIPLQVSEETHGTSKLRLNLTNQNKILDTASKEINIEY